jgi:hypothetical protein
LKKIFIRSLARYDEANVSSARRQDSGALRIAAMIRAANGLALPANEPLIDETRSTA